MIDAELALFRQADLVLFSSQGLLDRYGAGLQRTLLVRNAVDASGLRGRPPWRRRSRPAGGRLRRRDRILVRYRSRGAGSPAIIPRAVSCWPAALNSIPSAAWPALPNVEFIGRSALRAASRN